MVSQRKKTGKSTALSVRAIAAQVILQVLDQGKSLSTLLPEVQSQVKPQDLPLLQEITFGICRLLPRLGCLNVHGSLLPRWRGAAPIQRSIWAGDQQTGVTIMQMDMGLDTGDMLHKVYCDIDDQETSASLYYKLAEIAPSVLIDVLDHLEEGKFIAEKQDDSQSNYAEKLSKEEAKLDWSLSAAQLERNIRAFNPWPISFLQLTDEQGNEQTLKVYAATVLPHVDKPAGTILSVDKKGIQIATKEGVLNLLQLQPAGKKPMSVQDFLNGRADWFQVGKVLN